MVRAFAINRATSQTLSLFVPLPLIAYGKDCRH
jgi:hypothetical protein